MEIRRRSSSDFTRIFDILSYQQEKYPNAAALNAFENGRWKGYSIEEIQRRVDIISCCLIENNFKKNDKIIFVPVTGSPEWTPMPETATGWRSVVCLAPFIYPTSAGSLQPAAPSPRPPRGHIPAFVAAAPNAGRYPPETQKVPFAAET